MTLFRRLIFTHHQRHHHFKLRCIFSSSSSSSSSSSQYRYLSSSPFSSVTAPSPQQQPDDPAHTGTSPRTRWSSYADIIDSPTKTAPAIGDHELEEHEEEKQLKDQEEEEDGDEEDEEEEEEVEEPRYAVTKQRERSRVETASSIHGGEDVLPERIISTKRSGGAKAKVKAKKQWLCSNCGYTTGKWWGICPSCELSGTMKEFHEAKVTDSDKSRAKSGLAVSEDAVGLWLPQNAAELRPIKLEEVNKGFSHQHWRIPLPGTFGNEVSTVLGGGLVPGSLTLVSGDPGIGKSTLLLQMAATIAKGHSEGKKSRVLYVSGEESLEQIGNRAERLGIKSDIYLYSSTDVEDILKKAQLLSPRAMVVDSIQTVYLKGLLASAGGILQVKECTAALMRFAKTTNIPILLVGHVNKSGDVAGPRMLEHIVDVVLY
ncbi:hypothetical protein PIB30_084574, partial [Stylosanthes scabra]|nr:hypothetical protein [Stylosanthes scabra]